MQYPKSFNEEAFDFSRWQLPEIRAAIEIVSGWRMEGDILYNDAAKALATILSEKQIAHKATVYVATVRGMSTRTVTPFNFESVLADRYEDYDRDEQKCCAAGYSFPVVANLVKYNARDAGLQSLVPGAVFVPFDAIYAMNVSVVAATTSYNVTKGIGRVIPKLIPVKMYDGAPQNGEGISLLFSKNCAGENSLVGDDWASWLYHKHYESRKSFNHTVCEAIPMTDAVKVGKPPVWECPFKPNAWGVPLPVKDVSRLDNMMKMQAFRSKDNTGFSAMTYAAYGEGYGASYRISEKIGNFVIFLGCLTDDEKKMSLRYISTDERELVLAMKECATAGQRFVHYYDRDLDDVEPQLKGKYVYAGQIIYDPKCCTPPFTGKMIHSEVDVYKIKNRDIVTEYLTKYQGAHLVGVRAHVMGMESDVVGMACPHNGVGVIVAGRGKSKKTPVWNLILIAGYVRNTYLFTRKTLAQYLVIVDVQNAMNAKVDGKITEYMPWTKLDRPQYHAFTKEQRRRYITLLREEEIFGEIPDNVADTNLRDMIDQAMKDPVIMSKMVKRAKQEKEEEDNITRAIPVARKKEIRREKESVAAERLESESSEDEDPPLNITTAQMLERVNQLARELEEGFSLTVPQGVDMSQAFKLGGEDPYADSLKSFVAVPSLVSLAIPREVGHEAAIYDGRGGVTTTTVVSGSQPQE